MGKETSRMEIMVFLVKKTTARRIADVYKKQACGRDHYLTCRLWNDFKWVLLKPCSTEVLPGSDEAIKTNYEFGTKESHATVWP